MRPYVMYELEAGRILIKESLDELKLKESDPQTPSTSPSKGPVVC